MLPIILLFIFLASFESSYGNICAIHLATHPDGQNKILILTTDYRYPQQADVTNFQDKSDKLQHFLLCLKQLDVPTSVFYSSMHCKSEGFGKNALEATLSRILLNKKKAYFHEGDIIGYWKAKNKPIVCRPNAEWEFYNIEMRQLFIILKNALDLLCNVKLGIKTDTSMLEFIRKYGMPDESFHIFWDTVNNILDKTTWGDFVGIPYPLLAQITGIKGSKLETTKILERLEYYECILNIDLGHAITNIPSMCKISPKYEDLKCLSLLKISLDDPYFFSTIRNHLSIQYTNPLDNNFKMFEAMLNASFLLHLFNHQKCANVLFINGTYESRIISDLEFIGYNITKLVFDTLNECKALELAVKTLG